MRLNERWGGDRMIPSGLEVARRRDESAGFNTTRLLSRRLRKGLQYRLSTSPPQPEGMHKLALYKWSRDDL